MKFLFSTALTAGLIAAIGQIAFSDAVSAAVITDAGDPLLTGATVITFDEVPADATDPTIGNVTFTGDTRPLQIGNFGPFANRPLLGNPTGGLLGTSYSIDFATPVLAFAMDMTAISNFPVVVEAYDDVGILLGSLEFDAQLGEVLDDVFAGLGGFVSRIASVRVETRDFFGIDNFHYTTVPTTPGPVAVAEPATLALFGLGLAGLGFASRSRRAR